MAKEVVFFNGLKMPIVGLGTFQRRDSSVDVSKAVDVALEKGYRHIDTAYYYQNEGDIGRTLKKWLDSGRIKREDLFIVTKLPFVGNRAESVEEYLKRSLTALQLDYVDLYLVHGPIGFIERGDEMLPLDENKQPLVDPKTDHISIWKAMEAQVDAGRAKSIGLSNFNARQIKRIVKAARIQPANLQIELQVYFQRKELVAFCRALDITICAYGPLGSPGLTDYRKKIGIRNFVSGSNLVPLADPVVAQIAKKHNKTAAQVLLRHLMQKGIVVIPKSVNPNRLEENIQVYDFNLSDDEMQELNELDRDRAGSSFGSIYSPALADHPENPNNDPY